MFGTKIKVRMAKGGGGDTSTAESIPEWARPYLENVGRAAEEANTQGTLGNVAGTNPLLNAAFGSGATAIADTTNEGLENTSKMQGHILGAGTEMWSNFDTLKGQRGVVEDQQDRLAQHAMSGGYDTAALKDKAILEAGVRTASLANQHGAAGTLGSARQAVRQGAMDAATAAEFATIDRDAAQQNYQNKLAAEQGIGSTVNTMGNLAQGINSTAQGVGSLTSLSSNMDQGKQAMAMNAAQGFSKLGDQARGIEQETGDTVWQQLQRYASTIYGNPARQTTVAGGGGK